MEIIKFSLIKCFILKYLIYNLTLHADIILVYSTLSDDIVYLNKLMLLFLTKYRPLSYFLTLDYIN